MKLSAGDHKLELVNYGYSPANRDVRRAGRSTKADDQLSTDGNWPRRYRDLRHNGCAGKA
jgi:hypothetical protein